MVLCDFCNKGYHTDCKGLDDVPAGEWFCSEDCLYAGTTPTKRASRQSRSKRKPRVRRSLQLSEFEPQTGLPPIVAQHSAATTARAPTVVTAATAATAATEPTAAMAAATAATPAAASTASMASTAATASMAATAATAATAAMAAMPNYEPGVEDHLASSPVHFEDDTCMVCIGRL